MIFRIILLQMFLQSQHYPAIQLSGLVHAYLRVSDQIVSQPHKFIKSDDLLLVQPFFGLDKGRS